MRILYDGRFVQDRFPGVGRYAFELIRSAAAASPETSFGVLLDTESSNSRFPLRVELERFPNVEFLPTRLAAMSLAEQLQPWKFRRFSADLYHVPFYVYPYLSFLPTVVTIYDLIPLHHPETTGTPWGAFYRAAIRLSLNRCRRLLTVSEFSKREICDYWEVDPEKVCVVYPGVGPDLVPREEDCAHILSRYGIENAYVLYLGNNKPHKNLFRLLQAWAGVRNRGGRTLALGGLWRDRPSDVEAEISRLGLSDSVRLLGSVPESDLSALYSQSEAFVFPSLYEGFGLPVLEAMACGAPVLCSDSSSLPEVAGDAAILINPLEVDQWTAALEEVLSSPALRDDLRSKALARAKRFNWDLSARKLVDCYHHAVFD